MANQAGLGSAGPRASVRILPPVRRPPRAHRGVVLGALTGLLLWTGVLLLSGWSAAANTVRGVSHGLVPALTGVGAEPGAERGAVEADEEADEEYDADTAEPSERRETRRRSVAPEETLAADDLEDEPDSEIEPEPDPEPGPEAAEVPAPRAAPAPRAGRTRTGRRSNKRRSSGAPTNRTVEVGLAGKVNWANLRSVSGTWRVPGPVPPGAYDVTADLVGWGNHRVGVLTVPDRRAATLRCNHLSGTCVME